VGFPIPFRHQHRQRTPHHFVFGIPEDDLGTLVPELDPPAPVGQDEGVGGRLRDRMEARRHIPGDADDADNAAGPAAFHGRGHVEGHRLVPSLAIGDFVAHVLPDAEQHLEPVVGQEVRAVAATGVPMICASAWPNRRHTA
jgi:hypothetical protein